MNRFFIYKNLHVLLWQSQLEEIFTFHLNLPGLSFFVSEWKVTLLDLMSMIKDNLVM